MPIDPELSLELRIRWLEVLLLGVKQAKPAQDFEKGIERRDGESLVLSAEAIQKKLDDIVESNDGLRKFMDRCMFLYIRNNYRTVLPALQMNRMSST